MVCVLTMAVFYSKVLNYQRGFCLLFAPKNGLLDFCFKKILERTQYAGSLDPNFLTANYHETDWDFLA